MANETLSPNMSMPVPGVSLTDGPQWATDLNNCLSILDSHSHVSGSGVPITPDAISMTADLPFLNNSATGLKSSVYGAQSSLATLRAIYVISKDLYYNDADGNVVRITQSGGVAGSPGSISNLVAPASAAYSAAASKFIWQSDSNIAADMDFGAIITRNITPNSTFAITISPPAALASNYGLTWPVLPASQKFMTLDASGNMAAPWAVDNSTLEISGGTTLQVKPGGIGSTQLASGLGLVFSGCIVAGGNTAAPSGWLLCDGTSYLRADYPTLFTAIGTAYGAADGTHFNVPAGQGYFLRGVSGASSNDPDKNARTAQFPGGNTGNNVGSEQSSTFQSHTHTANVTDPGHFHSFGSAAGSTFATGSANRDFTTTATNNTNSKTTGITVSNTSSGGSTETRPLNLYVNYFIKT